MPITVKNVKQKAKDLSHQEQEYFCALCNHYHKKYINHKVSKIYKEHYDARLSLTKSQAFKRMFISNWQKEARKQEQEKKKKLSM